ncbi:hypothetical protein BpOF4_16560 [Alkalihalophilus pseudofirmus OF4]|uniref:DUF3021 domain-containing protein n=1 Tax=Alkalihalophilus pseudofirmus (strain ATCC BAA-2126 / JCM 17055 / OF4) TaxID=398511 RepID=D3FQ64_ALKPO|nr:MULTISPECIES: hypothetical protein [Alkalihalophilus]ADC51357.1 hypothetical protein BpOF4_16560 [Alkalihalophilus pseudofirmus OF4]MED1601941.1 hypothetical protein [Alkalihalophilus marmarensis]
MIRIVSFGCSLIPAAFLFHFYEYSQHLRQEDANFLFIASLLFVAIAGILSTKIDVRFLLAANLVHLVISVVLAMSFLPAETSWFNPVGRDIAVALTAILFIVGIWIIRYVSLSLQSSRKKTNA